MTKKSVQLAIGTSLFLFDNASQAAKVMDLLRDAKPVESKYITNNEGSVLVESADDSYYHRVELSASRSEAISQVAYEARLQRAEAAEAAAKELVEKTPRKHFGEHLA